MKKTFQLFFVLSLVFAWCMTFAQDGFVKKDIIQLHTSLGNVTESMIMNPDAECTGAGELIYDDGTFENGYGWNPVVTDGRFVSLFTPLNYPWQFNTFCLSLTRVAASPVDFTFDIVMYDNTGAGGAPGNQIGIISGVTATNLPVWPTLAFYDFAVASLPSVASGSVYIGIKYNPSLAASPHYSGADESATTALHIGYAYDGTAWSTIQTLFTTYKAMGYRTLGSAPFGPGAATNPNPANGATGVSAPNVTLSWTNPGGQTSNAVYFGADPGSLTQIYSGTPISSIGRTGLLNGTKYYWRVDETDGTGTTTGATWNFTTVCGIVNTFPFSESFDGTTFPPMCWDNIQVSGTGLWKRVTAGTYPTCSPHSGAGMTQFNSFSYSAGTAAILATPQINFPSAAYEVSFWMYRDPGYATLADRVEVYYNTAPNLTGAQLLGTINRSMTLDPVVAVQGWYQYRFNMPGGSSGNAYILFDGISQYGNNMYVDDIVIGPSCLVGLPSNPSPADGALGVPITGTNLSWTNGANTTNVEVWFGPSGSISKVYDGAVKTSHTLGTLTYSTSYLWYIVCKDAGCGVTGPTWSFTTTQDPSFIFYEPFNTIANWTPIGPLGLTNWTVQNTNNAGGNAAPELQLSWTPSFNGLSKLVSTNITTAAVNQLHVMELDHYLNFYAVPGPFLGIGISYDNGATYTPIWEFESVASVGPEHISAYFTPTASPFQLVLYCNGDSYNINYWYVDDIVVTLPLANDVGTFSVDIASTIGPGTIAPQATVKNFGANTNTFNVQMTIGGYSSTKTVTSLAPGATQQVTFDNWNATIGTYNVNVCTQLGTDQNTANDCLSKVVNVSNAFWSSGSLCPVTTYLGSGAASNGYLYSIGGNTASGLKTEGAKYNVATDTWTPIAPLPAGRGVFATAIVGNYLYAIGGYDNASACVSTVYKYDISGDVWTTVASLPVTLAWSKAVAYNNNYIYVAGGYDCATVVQTVYLYNISTDTWTTATPMPAARFGGAFGLTGNKLVYVAGVDLTLLYTDVYVGTIDGTDPSIITWATMDSPFPGTVNESYSISSSNHFESVVNKMKPTDPNEATPYPPGTMFKFDAATWGTDAIIVAGGDPTASWVPANPNPCYVYKPATDTWIQQADVPIPVLGSSLGSVNNGSTWKLIVATGYIGSVTTDATQIFTDNLGGSATFQLTVNIANGWNMVSIPGLHPTDQNVNTWWAFRDLGANVFRYAGGYQPVTAAAPGIGYWMKHAGARVYNTGEEWPAGGIQTVAHDPLSGASGWNLFGGYELSVTAANVLTNPPGLQSGPIYRYSGGYAVATTLDPGYGYWIKLTGAGQIIIPETMAKGEVEYFAEDWGRIILTDATGINYTLYAVKGEVNLDNYELPPAPPTGMFDIRFSSGKIAEDINSSVKSIDMSGVTYPLTVRVEGMDIRLMDETGKTINVNLKAGEDIVISDASIMKLMVSGELIPAKYALEQNYPNPFNPSTVIEFSLPEDVSNVKLSIYNALGEKVAELVNTSLTAGKYQYQWNAQNVATGMYIYELRTDKFVSVKKMLLLK